MFLLVCKLSDSLSNNHNRPCQTYIIVSVIFLRSIKKINVFSAAKRNDELVENYRMPKSFSTVPWYKRNNHKLSRATLAPSSLFGVVKIVICINSHKIKRNSRHRVDPVHNESHVYLYSTVSLQLQYKGNVEKYDQFNLTLIKTDLTLSLFY